MQTALFRSHPFGERHQEIPQVCPVCGAMVEAQKIRDRVGWTCWVGGLAHYFQARYGHLKPWFTSGEGNLREPVIQAMDCSSADRAA